MGHPVNSIKYVLDQWDFLQRESFPFYAFVIFREKDRTFAEFFRSHFALLDEYSASACMFFAISPPPPDWSRRASDRDYWRHYMANADHGIGYTDVAVSEAARFFHLEEEHLPSIVIFRNIRHRDHIAVRLKGLEPRELETFFYNLFEFFRAPLTRQMPLWEVRLFIDFLPFRNRISTEQINEWLQTTRADRSRRHNPRRFDDLAGANDRAVRIEESSLLEDRLRNVEEYLEIISGQIRRFQEETREQFDRVNVQIERAVVILEGLAERIEAARSPLIERYVQIDEDYDDPYERLLAREQLFQKFDEFLLGQVLRVGNELQAAGARLALPSTMIAFDDILEPSSRQQLMTAELMWQNTVNLPANLTMDYSVCAIGIWKTLECETNRTFVDALRVHNRVAIPGSASVGQQYARRGHVSEKGLIPPKTTPKEITITENRDGYLIGLMLGAVAGLVDYGQNNSLQLIFQGVPNPSALHRSPTILFHDVALEIRTVANRYRNSYAHLNTMNRTICQEFRDFIFTARDSNPLYFTLLCKRVLRDARVI